jgi:plastocyanin
MRARTIALVAAGTMLVALIVGGVGLALASGHSGWAPWGSTPGSMMNGQYSHSSMMGSNGHGSMMGGGQYNATPQATAVVGTTQVRIVNFAFAPAHIQVRVGTKVAWTNTDAAPHTVTFMPMYRMNGSSMMQQGQSFSYTFTTPGTYAYYCAVHPNMTATVTVTP